MTARPATRPRRSPRPAAAAHWKQSYPFSCGPAALGSVLSELGWRPPGPRTSEETALWRESTAVGCPGAHPYGLALAARARGFRAEIWEDGPRPWLGPHVVHVHRLLGLSAYRRVDQLLLAASRAAGIPSHRGPRGPTTPAPGLLLVTDHEGPSTAPDPHWIGLVPAADGSWRVHDPLRAAAIRSTRTFGEWWAASGFEGTRTWMAVSRADAAPSGGAEPSQGRIPAPDPAGHHHGHPHPLGADGRPTELARRPWTRAEAIAALDAPDRVRTQDPAIVWRHARLRPGMTVVEVGAGTGYFALPAARLVGEGGRVYAVDLSEDLVELVRERAAAERLPQLRAVQSSVDRIPLPARIADIVLLANVLHDIPAPTLAEAVRLLRPGGRLVNVDWKPSPTPHGPPASIRIAPAAASRLLGRHGLRTVERWTLGPWHYGLTLLGPGRVRGPERDTSP